MTDKAWVDMFAKLVGVPLPTKPLMRPGRKPLWSKAVIGIRAYRFLDEILPYLLGSKRREAEWALKFFSPNGLRKGRLRAKEIWPPEEFPLKVRKSSRPFLVF